MEDPASPPTDLKTDRRRVASIALQQLVKQKQEVGTVSESSYVEAPEILLPEEEVASGASKKQIEEKVRKMAASSAAGYNTTALGVGMRDLGFAISKTRGELDQKGGDGARINVRAIAKEAETKINVKKYTLAELQAPTLPKGVPKDQKEKYLNDEEFVVVFGMERADYESMPPWKQKNLKQKVGLF
jgi:hypothetical protein